MERKLYSGNFRNVGQDDADPETLWIDVRGPTSGPAREFPLASVHPHPNHDVREVSTLIGKLP